MIKNPSQMRAVLLTGHGGLDRLVLKHDVPVPKPGKGEVLIKVSAAGINNTDINTRIGWYSDTVTGGTTRQAGLDGYEYMQNRDGTWGGGGIRFPRIQGADVCGHVVATGDDEACGLIGRRVMIDPWFRVGRSGSGQERVGYFGSEFDGGYAEFTKAPFENVHVVEAGWSDTELASFATSYVTAENMLERAGVQRGERILVTGASGGVGSALIQLACRRGALPVAVSNPSKHKQLRALGAADCLPRDLEGLQNPYGSPDGAGSVDVVADVVGGETWPQLIQALKRNGRYVCAGAIAGPVVKFDLRPFYLNDLSFYGATVVPQGRFANLVRYIEQNEIKPLVAATYPLEQIREAQTRFLEKNHIGNIVITL